jgi:hypothetical protein
VAGGEETRSGFGVALRDHGDEAAAHVEDLPHLGVGHAAEVADKGADRRDPERVGDLEADIAAEAREIEDAAAGDVREAVDRDAGAKELEDRADVDDGRLEQGVGDRGAVEGSRAVVEREAGQRLASE